MLRITHVLVALVTATSVAACGSRQCPQPPPQSQSQPQPQPQPEPPPSNPPTLADIERLLASPDAAQRDKIAFEALVKRLQDETAQGVDDATVAALRDRLTARTAAPIPPAADPAAADAVFARSFAALALSVVAARETKRSVWTPAELEAQVAAAAAYAARETDLRGFTGPRTGWAHAAAHTADWLKFLARHPKLTPAQARTILDALANLATRRHGARFSHGEDERLAAAARAVLRRGLLDDAAVDAWLRAVGEPLAAGWPDPFDPVLYAAQRNARDLLVSVHVALSFDDAPPAAAALVRLRAFMMQ